MPRIFCTFALDFKNNILLTIKSISVMKKVYLVTFVMKDNCSVIEPRILGVFTDKSLASNAIEEEFEDVKQRIGFDESDTNFNVEQEKGQFFSIFNEIRECLSVECKMIELEQDIYYSDIEF